MYFLTYECIIVALFSDSVMGEKMGMNVSLEEEQENKRPLCTQMEGKGVDLGMERRDMSIPILWAYPVCSEGRGVCG